jgi:ADP-heptose:LPS heptosyltransferase
VGRGGSRPDRRGSPGPLTGGAAERELAAGIAASAGLAPDRVLAGRTDLLGLASLVAAARLLISVDTGVAHLATATGTPSVVLLGPRRRPCGARRRSAPQHGSCGRAVGDNFAPGRIPDCSS